MPNGYSDTPAGRALARAADLDARSTAAGHLNRQSGFLARIETEFGPRKADEAYRAALEAREGVPGLQQQGRAADAVKTFYEALKADGARLFNCCEGGREPDWSRFVRLEISGCVDEIEHVDPGAAKNGSTFFVSGCAAANADMFTLYGVRPDGDGDAIADCATLAEADAVGRELAQRSGLPVIDDPGLARDAGAPAPTP